MSILNDPNMKRAIIMDHYQYPRNKGLKEAKGYSKVHMAAESCIDDIYVEAKIENDIIEDLNFDGVGCTISTASTSIMCELLKGKSLNEAKEIIDNYIKMLNMEKYDEEILNEAVVFSNTGRQANRISCALIGFNGLLELIKEAVEKGDKSE